MKNVFTLALILVAASILVSSCSQFSNTSLIKSHSPGNFYVEQGAIKQSEPKKVENNTFSEKGFSTVQTDRIDREVVKDTLIANYNGVSAQQPIPVTVSNNKEEKNNVVFSTNNSDVKILKLIVFCIFPKYNILVL